MKLYEAQHNQFLDIDYLRRLEVEPAYFGLGFIQLKVNLYSRIHFYHDELPVLVDEPHDHRYKFTSYIIQGKFKQTLYAFNENSNGAYEMAWEDCQQGDTQAAPVPVQGDLNELLYAEFQTGDYYTIEPDTLHTVSAEQNAITYLNRNNIVKNYAGVVRKIGAEKVCPFSSPIPVDECWQMIEAMLPTKHVPGYHLRQIAKGQIGEVSKIIEEAEELLDAHEQGIKIMELVELSDLYGAMVRYLETHHPGMKMKDIKKMHEVTRRAFDNKQR